MGLHDDTIAIANERGYLTFSEVRLVRAQAPAWFLRLACPEGIAEYQVRSGVTLPQTLVDFYAATDLVCFLIATGQGAGIFDATTFATDCQVRPPVEILFGRKYVIVDEHGHSASRGCVPLDCGDDPPVFGSIADDPLFDISPRFTKYVHDQVDGYDRQLRNWIDHFAGDPELPAWLTGKPGFDQLKINPREMCFAYFRRAIESPKRAVPWAVWWQINGEKVRKSFSQLEYTMLKDQKLAGAEKLLQEDGWRFPNDINRDATRTGRCPICNEFLIDSDPWLSCPNGCWNIQRYFGPFKSLWRIDR